MCFSCFSFLNSFLFNKTGLSVCFVWIMQLNHRNHEKFVNLSILYFTETTSTCKDGIINEVLIKGNNSCAHHIKSRQSEQKVGWRRRVAMNLCPLTWCTLLRIAPRRRLSRPSFSLKTLSFGGSGK